MTNKDTVVVEGYSGAWHVVWTSDIRDGDIDFGFSTKHGVIEGKKV